MQAMMIIPAAGLGTRLRSSMPKLLLPVNGKAMVDWLFDLYGPVVGRFVLILNPSSETAVRDHCRDRSQVAYVRQDHPTGMLDAILAPLEHVRDAAPDRIWITWCDQIAIHPETMNELARLSREHATAAMILPTARRPVPYIHIVRDGDGRIIEIRHRREGDAMPEVGESDMGLFSLSAHAYFAQLPQFAAEARQSARTGERNFLPFIAWLSQRGADVLTFPCRDEREAIGINTSDDLEAIERYLRERGEPVRHR
jgi:bifunctional N-acetylglucosamine-1-phosphate-uridyltransferase/glucosamine-1-phosphate-acetyltransferase GlmU-like protein